MVELNNKGTVLSSPVVPAVSPGDAKTKLSLRERAKLLTRKKEFNYDQHKLDKDNFHYHWTNVNGVSGSNVEMYQEAGYDMCIGIDGKPISRKGQVIGVSQYLMRVPIEDYKKIQKYKLEDVNEIERSLGKKGIPNLSENEIYGQVTTTPQVIVK
jgi:hypothetical protein